MSHTLTWSIQPFCSTETNAIAVRGTSNGREGLHAALITAWRSAEDNRADVRMNISHHSRAWTPSRCLSGHSPPQGALNLTCPLPLEMVCRQLEPDVNISTQVRQKDAVMDQRASASLHLRTEEAFQDRTAKIECLTSELPTEHFRMREVKVESSESPMKLPVLVC